MRAALLVLALGAVLLARGTPRAADGGRVPTPEETLREQLEALDEIEHAATDEEARAAEERFDAASERELQRRRESIEHLIER